MQLLRADDLSSDLCLYGESVQCLHGGHEQCDREEALKDFKASMLQEGSSVLNLCFCGEFPAQ